MEAIKIFENDRFGEVRVAGTSENPLFCLADVCNFRITCRRCTIKTDGCPIRIVTDSIGREQQMNFVNERISTR